MPVAGFLKNPHRRMLFELAERLGRTVGELLHGSPGHRSISSNEITEWMALWELRAWEQKQAMRESKRK